MASAFDKMFSYGVRSFSIAPNKGIFRINGLPWTHKELHITLPRRLPTASSIKLPDNYNDINASETCRFSPLRSRDISSSYFTSWDDFGSARTPHYIDVTVSESDPHIGPMDCQGAVSLSSSMQSNVPSPFGGQESILNMPWSQVGQGYKYLSDYQHESHYLTLRNKYGRNRDASPPTGTARPYHTASSPTPGRVLRPRSEPFGQCRSMSTDGRGDPADESKPPTRKQQLKQAVTAYGSTVIVFHVTISLASLGAFYLLVSSGLDVPAWLNSCGFVSETFSNKIAGNAGTFVVAYAVHKVFAPVRIGITLTATPFIVRYLRRVGILKTPPKA